MDTNEKMGYEALKTILDSNDVVKKYNTFGTNLPANSSVQKIAEKSISMLTRCKVWATNWETVQEAIAPDLEVIKQKQIEEKVASLSAKDLKYLEEAVKRLKEQAVA